METTTFYCHAGCAPQVGDWVLQRDGSPTCCAGCGEPGNGDLHPVLLTVSPMISEELEDWDGSCTDTYYIVHRVHEAVDTDGPAAAPPVAARTGTAPLTDRVQLARNIMAELSRYRWAELTPDTLSAIAADIAEGADPSDVTAAVRLAGAIASAQAIAAGGNPEPGEWVLTDTDGGIIAAVHWDGDTVGVFADAVSCGELADPVTPAVAAIQSGRARQLFGDWPGDVSVAIDRYGLQAWPLRAGYAIIERQPDIPPTGWASRADADAYVMSHLAALCDAPDRVLHEAAAAAARYWRDLPPADLVDHAIEQLELLLS